jgi:hypothetical protein
MKNKKSIIISYVTSFHFITLFAGVAQLVVHFTRNEGVAGSNPVTSIYWGLSKSHGF